jgi:PIN domain nuclease of toxin-antitoxin system
LKILLDTHIAVWRLTGDARLSTRAIAVMDNLDNYLSVSTISIWEMAIKSSLRRENELRFPFTGAVFLKELDLAGVKPLPILPQHTILVDDLPFIHSDPFDRALIATAVFEGMTLLTHDKILGRYGDFVMVV